MKYISNVKHQYFKRFFEIICEPSMKSCNSECCIITLIDINYVFPEKSHGTSTLPRTIMYKSC